jgi:hypothetical protein
MGIILKMNYNKGKILPPLFRNNYTQEGWEKSRQTEEIGGKDRLTNGQINRDLDAKIDRHIKMEK